tara:strand:+ start:186 stop:506 length:321 start_codon:yes stop_codon:yes gene_type:complete
VNLIIDSSLSEPPSEVSCFRDVTLYSKIFIFDDVLLQCPTGTRSLYWKWLKKHGAHDFISDLISINDMEAGVKISPFKGNIIVSEINYNTLSHIIKCLQVYAKLRT